MGTIRQITSFEMPDGGVGHGANGWGISFDQDTLSGSTIITFPQIAATNGPVITAMTDSAGNAHTLQVNERNTSFGAEFWSAVRQNCAVIPAGWSGRVGSATSTTITDDTLTARGKTWTTDHFKNMAYKNYDNGDTGTVTGNNTTGTLTISGMANLPGAGQMYSVGGYVKTTITGSGDYYGLIGVEVSGVASSSLIISDGVQGSYTNGQTISCPTHALGSSPVTIVAVCLNDTNVVNTPTAGSGFTDDGTYMKWDQAAPMARLQHRLLSNPGTTGATFTATAADHYQAIYVALLDATASPAGIEVISYRTQMFVDESLK